MPLKQAVFDDLFCIFEKHLWHRVCSLRSMPLVTTRPAHNISHSTADCDNCQARPHASVSQVYCVCQAGEWIS